MGRGSGWIDRARTGETGDFGTCDTIGWGGGVCATTGERGFGDADMVRPGTGDVLDGKGEPRPWGDVESRDESSLTRTVGECEIGREV